VLPGDVLVVAVAGGDVVDSNGGTVVVMVGESVELAVDI